MGRLVDELRKKNEIELPRSSEKTLYCFCFDSETGLVTKIDIPRYVARRIGTTGRYIIAFTEPKIIKCQHNFYEVPSNRIDKFVHDKVFSFDPSIMNACGIMGKTLDDRIQEFQTKLNYETDRAKKLIKANFDTPTS